MKRNFNVVVKGMDGTAHVERVDQHDEYGVVLADKDGNPVFDKYVPVTLRKVAINALAARYRGEEMISGDDLVKRMRLADKLLYAGDQEINITADEGKMILDTLIKMGASALIFTRMKDLIDTDPVKPAAAVAEAPTEAAATE